ncbi:hypothetical protein COBT_002954 [Conglomerata obtusa]
MKFENYLIIFIAHQCLASSPIFKVDGNITQKKVQTLSKDYMLYSYTISPDNNEGSLAELVEQIEYATKNFIQADSDKTKNPKLHFPINIQLLKSLAGEETIHNSLSYLDFWPGQLTSSNKTEKEKEKALNSDKSQDIKNISNKYIFDTSCINNTVRMAFLSVMPLRHLAKTDISDDNSNQFPNNTTSSKSTNNSLFIFSFVEMDHQTTKELYKYIIRLQSIRKTDFNNAKILFFMKTDHIKDIQNVTFKDFASENVRIEDCVDGDSPKNLIYGINVITYSKNYQIDRFFASPFTSSQLIIRDNK